MPGYAATPLTEVPGLAGPLGVGRVFVKDESARFDLGAFKILGASYAVFRALSARLDGTAPSSLKDLRTALERAPGPRLVTATDGNHGRAVARMAAALGLGAEVFVPEVVTDKTVSAIAGEGAEVTVVRGPYDETVRQASKVAADTGALLVQDTAWEGYEQIPAWIVAGYETLFAEIDEQLAAAGADPAGLVAVPTGVGSLLQAAVQHHRGADEGATGAVVLSVEPDTAACVLSSLAAGEPVTVPTAATRMAGLNCGTVSRLAWPVLRDGVDAAVAVTEGECERAEVDLSSAGVSSGPSGAASLAGARVLLAAQGAGLPDLSAATAVLLSTEAARGTSFVVSPSSHSKLH